MASSTSTVRIISVTFSFFQLFAKLPCTYFQHHKRLLQADIHVCTPTCESHRCRKQEILDTFKSPKFLGLRLGSVWDVCEGHIWRTTTTASVTAGTQWGGWKKIGGMKKNCLNNRGLEKLHTWVVWQYSTQIRPHSCFRSAMVFSAGQLQHSGNDTGVVHWS